jgi:hypothetical protein
MADVLIRKGNLSTQKDTMDGYLCKEKKPGVSTV